MKLNKTLILLVLFTTYIICFGTIVSKSNIKDEGIPQIYSRVTMSSVFVSREITIGVLPTGKEITIYSGASAFVFNKEKGLILTAGHFASYDKDPNNISFFLIEGDKKTPITIVKVDTDNDLAVLRVDPSAISHKADVEFCYNAFIGEMVFAVGSPLRMFNTISIGILSHGKLNSIDLWEKSSNGVWITDATTDAGSSGGMIVNLRGEVIGMSVGRFGGFTVVIPASTIKEFIANIN